MNNCYTNKMFHHYLFVKSYITTKFFTANTSNRVPHFKH